MKISKKIIATMLSIMMLVSCMPMAFATEETNVSLTARSNKAIILINGVITNFEAYNIKDNNYFKLRDIAQAISGTEKQFDVGFDEENNSVSLTSNKAYTTIGGEMSGGDGTDKIATTGTSNIMKDGEAISLTAYLVNDNNFFKLRDLGQTFDFEVAWDEKTNVIMVNTSKSYTGANASMMDNVSFYEKYSDVPDMGAFLGLPMTENILSDPGTEYEANLYDYNVESLESIAKQIHAYAGLLSQGASFYYFPHEQYSNVAVFIAKSGRMLTLEWYRGEDNDSEFDCIRISILKQHLSEDTLSQIQFGN